MGAIKYRVATGRLIPVYAGVYAVGYVRRTPEARACAAVLACGEQAALSHRSAASLWGFSKHWDEPFEVIAPSIRRREGIRVHRCRTLARPDMTRQLGIRVTSPARTVLDNAPRLTGKPLARFVNDALRTPYLHAASLADVLNRNPDHPGAKRLRRFVEDSTTNSPLEDDFLEFAREHGLPTPVTNTHLLGYEIDVLYPRELVHRRGRRLPVPFGSRHLRARSEEGRRDARGGLRDGPDNRRTDEQGAGAGSAPVASDPVRPPAPNSYGSLKLP